MRAPRALAADEPDAPACAGRARWATRLNLLSIATGSFSLLTGGLALIGWWTGREALIHIRAEWPAMVANTALLHVLAGAALIARARPGRGLRARAGIATAWLATALAAITLAGWLLHWSHGIEHLWLYAGTTTQRFPGRTAPPTALSFALIGAALSLLDRESRRGPRVSELLCLLALPMPILALLGYWYGISRLYSGLPLLIPFTGMAIHTALALVALGIGVFAARPTSGLMGVLTSTRAGGDAARRMLVAILALPLTAWLVTLGVRAEWYPPEVGTALVVFVSLLDVGLLLLATGGRLERKDLELRRALADAAHEISERKAAISALKELERQREEWTSIVAHDLRQPISSISLASERFARHKTELPPSDRETFERIRRSVAKLTRMIEDLLDASRLEAQRLSVVPEPVNVRKLIEEITVALPELDGHPVELRFPPAEPWISADQIRADQIFRNLLSNAGKYAAPGTTVEVAVEPHADAFEITVENRGPGIAREDMGRLFQRFGRPEASKRTGVSGIGLGLYITKGLVQAHGGRIWAESTPGETTRFHVLLPALAAQAQPS